MPTWRPHVVLLLCVGTFASPSRLAGQQAPAAPPPSSLGIGILDAATSTLQSHPLLQAQQKQLEASRAVHLQTSGIFNHQLAWSAGHERSNSPLTEAARLSLRQSGFDVASESLNLTTLTGELSRLFRSGITVAPRLEIVRSQGSLQFEEGASRTRFSFDVNVPLQRGRGRDAVAAPETAAGLNVEASTFDLNQAAADLLLSTATSYWRYAGAVKQLEIVRGSEARAREYVQNVEVLVRADRVPSSEMFQVRANLAGRTANRIHAEQQLAEARSALGLAIGLPPALVGQVPPPSDGFPEERVVEPSFSPDRVQSYIETALANRADCLAAEKRKQAADVARRSSRNGVLPQLDLMLSGGYAGLQEGRGLGSFLDSVYTRTQGPDLLFGLRFSRPISNSVARGQLAEAEASYQQAALVSAEKAREAAAAVSSSLASVHLGIQRLDRAREAVALYQSALEGEKDKLRLAVGSLTDLLTVEDRLTSALVGLVGAQEAYASALARFRHATGTLVPPDRSAASVDPKVFFTVPALRAPQ